MTPAELDVLLRSLPKAGAAQLKRLQKQLAHVVQEPWFDHQCFATIERVCASRGLTVPTWHPNGLGVGETWLLLYESLAGTGSVARLTCRAQPAGGSPLWRNEAQDGARRALLGLVSALASLEHCLPEPSHHYHFSVEAPNVSARVVGDSLGVTVCVAVVSAALGKAARSDAAASAIVRADGTLGTVEFLQQKLGALRRRQPEVRNVVVAPEQLPAVEAIDGVRLIRCGNILEALDYFDLAASNLPLVDINRFRREVAQFEFDDDDTLAADAWRQLADHAFRAYQVLSRAGGAYRSEATRALAWWVLFSSHAGQTADLGTLRAELSELDSCVAPESTALLRVFSAAWEIDVDAQRAVASSRAALSAVELLTQGQKLILGRALGTHGRALMHAGQVDRALPFLQRAVEEHRRNEAEEVPRSLGYLATAARLAGNAEDALATTKQALVELGDSARHGWALKTRAYLELERGRCLLASSQPRPALAAFDWASATCEFDHEHPRSAALRGLAEANRLLNNTRASGQYFERCLRVAEQTSLPRILRRIAGMAIADRQLGETRLTEDQFATWLELFPGIDTPERIAKARALWVY